MTNYECDIAIIGAGAAGLMAGFLCAKKGKKVIILEHNDRPGKKILISGGGRCNFTNIYSSPLDFDSKNKHFCKSALSRFSPYDFVNLVEEAGISFFEKKLGQLFCTHSAKEIVQMLVKKNEKYGAQILYKQKDLKVLKENKFVINNERTSVTSDNLIVATGGLSIPTIGASDFGYQIAKKFGHKINSTMPALVGLKVDGLSELAGTSFIGTVTCNGKSVTEDILFTHKGLSGPAILKASLYYYPGDIIRLNFLPEYSYESLFEGVSGNTQYRVVLRKHLPNKLVDYLLDKLKLDYHTNVSDLSKDKKELLKKVLFDFKLTPTGTEGYRKAEVTRGGVDTDLVSSKTMESKLEKGLYFIGEVLDITGQLGGHNFQWAWASSFAASESF